MTTNIEEIIRKIVREEIALALGNKQLAEPIAARIESKAVAAAGPVVDAVKAIDTTLPMAHSADVSRDIRAWITRLAPPKSRMAMDLSKAIGKTLYALTPAEFADIRAKVESTQ